MLLSYFVVTIIYAAFDASSNFPGSLDDTSSLYDIAADDTIKHLHHDVVADACVKIETKLGSGSSTSVDNQVLTGTGSGTSAWAEIELAMMKDEDYGDLTKSTTFSLDEDVVDSNEVDQTDDYRFTGDWNFYGALRLFGTLTIRSPNGKIDSVFLSVDSIQIGNVTLDSLLIDAQDSLKFRTGGLWYPIGATLPSNPAN